MICLVFVNLIPNNRTISYRCWLNIFRPCSFCCFPFHLLRLSIFYFCLYSERKVDIWYAEKIIASCHSSTVVSIRPPGTMQKSKLTFKLTCEYSIPMHKYSICIQRYACKKNGFTRTFTRKHTNRMYWRGEIFADEVIACLLLEMDLSIVGALRKHFFNY